MEQTLKDLVNGLKQREEAQPAQTEVVEVKPKAKTKKESVVEEVKPESIIEDRSAFNCPDCRGEGLLNPRTICPRCLGTGKV